MRKGYVQIYTGDGKGKTTAAIGLAIRAAGAGLKVFFAQFIKNRRCSEHKALERFDDLITIKQYGRGFIRGKPSKEIERIIKKGFNEVKKVVLSGDYDIVILDEINVALHYNLLDTSEIMELIKNKPSGAELVLTGRYAPQKLIKKADLVTEMKKIKHYMDRGVKARTGIEK
ncbi:MAG: cob(I)yrinic acid a,c-diamide adenosyltransferase [Thermodesulfovibrionales bacterium]